MSKMPDDIKTAINDYASGRADKPMVIKHAEFGYSLSLERIGELEKEEARLQGLLETMVKGFAANTIALSTLENIELYWQEFKSKNNINP